MVGICRLCASLRKMDALTTITDASHEVCRKLLDCFKVEIRMDDALPKNICSDCLQALQTTFTFYTKVQEAQDSLAILFPAAKESSTDTEKQQQPTSALAESLTQAVQSSVEMVEENNRNTFDLPAVEKLKLTKQTERKRKIPAQECSVPKMSKVEYKVDYKYVKAKEKVETDKTSAPTVMSKLDDDDDDYLIEVYEVLDMKPNAEEMLEEDNEESAENLQLIEEYITKTSNEGVAAKNQLKENNPQEMHVEAYEQAEVEEELLEEDVLQEVLQEELQEVLQEELQEEQQQETEACSATETQEQFDLQRVEEGAEEKEDEVRQEDEEHLQEEHMEDKKNTIIYAELQHETWSTYPWRCSLCTLIANSFIELYAHAQEVHAVESFDDLQFTCCDCQKNCARYTLFLNHVRMHHHPLLALCCDACDTRCEDFGALDEHRGSDECVAEANDVFPEVRICGDCGKSYAKLSAVQVHARTQHTETGKSFECETCGTCFKRLSNLRAHMRVHSDDKDFACDLCGREFKHKINLEVHYFTHVSEKQFECTICNKKFKTSINLEKHAIVHTDIKQWKCSFCEKDFRTKDAQKSHERTHTGELPYACSYCPRRFRYRSTLTSHTNTHENVKPYCCQKCDHHFNNWSNYNKHMKRRHSAEAVAKAAAKLATKQKTKSLKKLPKKRVVSYIYDEQGEMVQSATVAVAYEDLEMPTEELDALEQSNSGEEEEILS